jgi:hypothetical protein
MVPAGLRSCCAGPLIRAQCINAGACVHPACKRKQASLLCTVCWQVGFLTMISVLLYSSCCCCCCCCCCCPAAAAGFIAGPRADALAGMGAQAAVQKFLAQLDEIFGSAQEPKPATAAYVKAHVFDWSQEQWVGGAYSFPSLGAEEGDREALAAPVAGTIFFAGAAACLCYRMQLQSCCLCQVDVRRSTGRSCLHVKCW